MIVSDSIWVEKVKLIMEGYELWAMIPMLGLTVINIIVNIKIYKTLSHREGRGRKVLTIVAVIVLFVCLLYVSMCISVFIGLLAWFNMWGQDYVPLES